MISFKGFSLQAYTTLFENTRIWTIVLNTVLIALLSATIATIIGTLGAIGIDTLRSKNAKSTFLAINNIMIVSPDVILGASFLLLFTFAAIQLGLVSVLLSHIAFSIPIVVIMVLPKLREMDKVYIDAARDLGASPIQVLTRVILPYIASSVYAGFFLALTYSLDDFAVTFFVTGNGFTTLSVEIYSLARRGISLEINALSTLLFLFTIVIAIGYYYLDQRGQKINVWGGKK